MIYDDKKFIGEVIKSARKRAGLSQAQLCEKLEMSDKNLGNIENGRQFPQLNNFFRIMEVLNLKIEDFGVKSETIIEKDKEEILKMVFGADKKELDAYYKILKTTNEIIQK